MSALANLLRCYGARRDQPLAAHTFLNIGGPADWFLSVESNAALETALRAAREEGCPVVVLGAGTNTLVGDRGIRGLVIQQNGRPPNAPAHRRGVEWTVLEADAGALFTRVSRKLSPAGRTGIEWAEGIPGSMGGAVVYNAGAYGGCLRDVLVDIDCIDPSGETRQLGREELHLDYRRSDFTRGLLEGWIVTRVRLRLERGDAERSAALIDEIAEQRKSSAPRGLSGGSTFRNPPGRRAWELIDAVGLRGHRIGGAQISPEHCNYFMNVGGATAADMTALIRVAQQRVRERFGVELEPELTSVGEGFA